MTLAAVDCHMVGQRAAGDAGNGRYAATMVAAMAQTAGSADTVGALVATAAGRAQMTAVTGAVASVPGADVPRLIRAASRVLTHMGAEAAVFTYVAPRHAPCPVLLAVHDATFITNPEWLSRRARTMLRLMVGHSARRARAVLVLSETARDDVAAALQLDHDMVRVVSPFAAACFHPDAAAAARVHARFGLRRYCLAVGDLGPRKNLVSLGAGMRRLNDPTLELALVGKPGHGGERIARDSGGRWLGHVGDEELADLYRAAAVTAYPSLYEGFGLPALEAMACGSPVVASNRGALPELTGGAAILVDPDPESIAEGLRAALEPAEADRLRHAGPLRATHYSATNMGQAAWRAVHEVAASASVNGR